MIDQSYMPLPNPDVIFQEEDDGWAVLVNLDTGNSLALNSTGRLIWKAADGRRSISDIIVIIKETFSGVPEDISDDIMETVGSLKANGFFGYEIKQGEFPDRY
jgi:hypothetical protein